jgi:hypothetical protein
MSIGVLVYNHFAAKSMPPGEPVSIEELRKEHSIKPESVHQEHMSDRVGEENLSNIHQDGAEDL